jgi:hypothetical protein
MLTKGFDHLGRPLPLSQSAYEHGDRKRRPRIRLRIARPMPAIGKIGRSLSGRAISLMFIAGVAASRARGLVSRCLIPARAVISSGVLDVSILVATATAVGVTILSLGNPLALVAEVKSAPQPGADESPPIILTSAMLSTANAEALPPIAKDASTHEIAAASELACQTKTENSEPSSSEALFRQFQAWAAEQDARARLGRDAQKHRSAARTEIQNSQEPRARVRQQSAQVQARPAKDARAEQDDPVLSFLLKPFRAGPP